MAEDGYSLKGSCVLKTKVANLRELAPRLGKTGLDILHQSGETQKGKGDFQLRLYLLAFPEPGQG